MAAEGCDLPSTVQLGQLSSLRPQPHKSSSLPQLTQLDPKLHSSPTLQACLPPSTNPLSFLLSLTSPCLRSLNPNSRPRQSAPPNLRLGTPWVSLTSISISLLFPELTSFLVLPALSPPPDSSRSSTSPPPSDDQVAAFEISSDPLRTRGGGCCGCFFGCLAGILCCEFCCVSFFFFLLSSEERLVNTSSRLDLTEELTFVVCSFLTPLSVLPPSSSHQHVFLRNSKPSTSLDLRL